MNRKDILRIFKTTRRNKTLRFFPRFTFIYPKSSVANHSFEMFHREPSSRPFRNVSFVLPHISDRLSELPKRSGSSLERGKVNGTEKCGRDYLAALAGCYAVVVPRSLVPAHLARHERLGGGRTVGVGRNVVLF